MNERNSTMNRMNRMMIGLLGAGLLLGVVAARAEEKATGAEPETVDLKPRDLTPVTWLDAPKHAPVEIVRCEGWRRDQWFDQTGLPWVFPSPNMPTVETAAIYPGMCLIEGTNLSEGRGTTRPFHLVGAPWLDREAFTRHCRLGAQDAGLNGVGFRAATFEPRFQKFAGQVCHGVELFVTDRDAMEPLLLGLVVLEAAMRTAPEQFKWRTETYEFVDDPIAIDLLLGSAEGRLGLEARVSPRELLEAWSADTALFTEQREPCLLY